MMENSNQRNPEGQVAQLCTAHGGSLMDHPPHNAQLRVSACACEPLKTRKITCTITHADRGFEWTLLKPNDEFVHWTIMGDQKKYEAFLKPIAYFLNECLYTLHNSNENYLVTCVMS